MKECTVAFRTWELDFGGSIESRPNFQDGVLYFGAADYNVFGVDAKTGKELWRFDAGNRIGAPALVHGDRVYFGSANGIVFAPD